MKSGVLLSSNLPSVIDRTNLSPISILMMTQGTLKSDDRTDFQNADSRNKPATTGWIGRRGLLQ